MHSRIDIVPDEGRPEGGYAKALIRDVAIMPPALQFNISAIPEDPDDPASHIEWSLGDHAPLAADITPEGLSLLLGPDIVDSPLLQPGTPVLFSVPDSDIRAELSWPDLPVSIPGKVATPVMDAADLRAKKLQQRKVDEQEALDAVARQEAAAARAASAAMGANAPLAAKLSTVAPFAENKPLASRTVNGPTGDRGTGIGPDASSTPVHQSIGLDLERRDTTGNSSAAMRAVSSGNAVDVLASLNLAKDTQPGPPAEPIGKGPSGPSVGEGAEAASTVAPMHEVAAVDGAGSDKSSSAPWLSIVLAVLAVPFVILAIWPSFTTDTMEPAARSAMQRLVSSDWVTRILAVGDVSPSGIDASKVTAQEALKRAERAIFDQGNRKNVAERKFWLRKSISKLLAEPQSQWATTQLGALETAAANKASKPDYRSAKILWELSSASGDSVATCFLAQLYELGLGVDANDEQAKRWYKQADKQGGCDLQHETPASALTN